MIRISRLLVDRCFPSYGASEGGSAVRPRIVQVGRQDVLMDGLVAAFDDRLSAVRLGYSTVIEISFNASNAERAAEIANAVANAYVTDQLNAKFEANRIATGWLQDRLKALGQQALTAERAVNAFKSQNNIVAAGGKLMDEQQVTDLNSRLVAARAQTSDALARLNRFETILKSNPTELGINRQSRCIRIGCLEQSDHQLPSSAISRIREARSRIFRPVWQGPFGCHQSAHPDDRSPDIDIGRSAPACRNQQKRFRGSQAATTRNRKAAGAGGVTVTNDEFGRTDDARAGDQRQGISEFLRELPSEVYGIGSAGVVSHIRGAGDLARLAPPR